MLVFVIGFESSRSTSGLFLKIDNPPHSAHSKLQGWSYAVLVHPMGGSHHHIGGSVGSHLPEIQQCAAVAVESAPQLCLASAALRADQPT